MVVFTASDVRSPHATVEPRKSSIYCSFSQKKKMDQMDQSMPEVAEVSLVKEMIVFLEE